jgi:transposase-like protein
MARTKHTKEFKLEVLKLAEQIEVSRASKDLGIADCLVYRPNLMWKEL